jgi:hypothetical protein
MNSLQHKTNKQTNVNPLHGNSAEREILCPSVTILLQRNFLNYASRIDLVHITTSELKGHSKPI